MMQLSDCEPTALCPDPVGKMWQLEKFFPMEEAALSASESSGDRATIFSSVEALLQSNRDGLRMMLEKLLLEEENNPMQPGG